MPTYSLAPHEETAVAAPPLPKWTDSSSVTSYITSLVATAVAILGAVHPGWHEPPVVEAVIPAVGILVAGLAQLVQVITHRSTIKAAYAARVSP